jgi:hypothetical protein
LFRLLLSIFLAGRAVFKTVAAKILKTDGTGLLHEPGRFVHEHLLWSAIDELMPESDRAAPLPLLASFYSLLR